MENIENSNYQIPGRNGGTLTPFRPGQSGNPSGLPKGTQHFKSIMMQMLNTEIVVTSQGKPVKMTNSEALCVTLLNIALTSPNDQTKLNAIMKIIERIDGKVDQKEQEEVQQNETVIFYIPNQNSRIKTVDI